MGTFPEEPKGQWLLQQPAQQIALVVAQAYWTAGIEEALRSSAPKEALAVCYQVSGRLKHAMSTISCLPVWT
jgi:hypothetical protein